MTREDVLKEIATIKDNEQNRAEKVRDVLIKLLDYTENVAIPPAPVVPFFGSEDRAVPNKDGNAELNYSFRGIENETVNFTFRLDFLKSLDNNMPKHFLFEISDPAFYKKLKIIAPHRVEDLMNFSVPIFDAEKKFLFTTEMQVFFPEMENGTGVIFISVNEQIVIIKNSYIFTSIHLHAPENIGSSHNPVPLLDLPTHITVDLVKGTGTLKKTTGTKRPPKKK